MRKNSRLAINTLGTWEEDGIIYTQIEGVISKLNVTFLCMQPKDKFTVYIRLITFEDKVIHTEMLSVFDAEIAPVNLVMACKIHLQEWLNQVKPTNDGLDDIINSFKDR